MNHIIRERQEKASKDEEDDMVNLMNIDEEGCFDENNKIFSNNHQQLYRRYNEIVDYDNKNSAIDSNPV